MRITLLCTDSLRTPACPGFGVSGGRKISCFGRFDRQREVGRELGLWGERLGAFERVQMRPEAEDRLRCTSDVSGSIERVQMAIEGANPHGIARMRGSFERVQTGREIGLRLRLPRAPEMAGALKRAELAWRLERTTARKQSSGSPFERVQMRFDFTVGRVPGGMAGPFERAQMGDGCGMRGPETRASGLFERVQMRLKFMTRRGAMPRLK